MAVPPGSWQAVTQVSSRGTVTMTMLRDQALFGSYVGNYEKRSGISAITSLEALLGTELQVLSVFTAWGEDLVPRSLLNAARGRPLLICLETSTAEQRYSAVTAGTHDAYLEAQAAACVASGAQIYIRVWSEFNLPDPPWGITSGGPAGGTAAEFRAAWSHVVTLFRDAGAANVRFVWNPDVGTYSGTADVRSCWPGSASVDVLGIDGYNWAGKYGDGWRQFTDLVGDLYATLTSLHPTADVWMCEFSSGEDGKNDKGTWVDLMLQTEAFPRMKGLCWFNVDKEMDWRVDSSASSLRAFRQNLASRETLQPPPTR